MGRHDPDPLPPIEIVGAAPPLESLQRVSTGPRGPRRISGRALAVALGVVVLLVGGLALGGSDDPPSEAAGEGGDEARDNSAKLPLQRTTTTTARGSTTTRPTTTTTTIPVGPVLGEPVGAGLLAFGAFGWHLVDLDTGAQTEVDLPVEEPYATVPVRGGVVIVEQASRQATFHPLGPAGAVGDPVPLGSADQVLAGDRPERVWLIDGGGRVNEGGMFVNASAEVRLVGVDGAVERSFQTSTPFVSQAVAAGVVVERGGRVYLADEGGIRPVAYGWTVGVIGDDLLVVSCDDSADCALLRQPLDGSLPRFIDRGIDVENEGYSASTSSDGRVALTGYDREGDQPMLLLSPDGGTVGRLDADISFDGAPRWLPGDHGLLLPKITGVDWLHREPRGWTATPVAALEDLPAELVLVIEW